MHGNVILDSSIIAAIFFPEKITEKAIEIAERHDCITVDLAYAEVANVAWKRVTHSSQDTDAVKSSLDECLAFIRETCQVIPVQDLVPEAYNLACSQRITIYNALFLAGAVQTESLLVTADTKLHTAAKKIVKTELVR
ncbi:MAG: type II toxin-antitoxin system VapC family toxin [Methanoregulaceae archaeon]